MKIYNISFAAFLAVIFLSACRTEPVLPPETKPPATGSELQQIADSVYLFSREIYFWDEIRNRAYDYDNFKPRDSIKGTDAVATAKAIISKIRSTNAFDRDKEYSYATEFDEGAATRNAAQTIKDYGFNVKAGYSNRRIYPVRLIVDNPYFSGFYVNYVYKNSDAGLKGVQRGWKVMSINGTDMTKISQTTVNRLNSMFASETLTSARIIFQKPNGQDTALDLSITNFVANSVLHREKIVSSTGKNIGYLVYNFFGRYADTKADLDEAIQYFKNQSVNEIVIDLRYNRGGYTQMQNYLADNFGPSSANGDVMYKMHYNSNLQAGNYALMRTRRAYDKDYYSVARNTVNFSVGNSFNTTKIYVIVGRSTASASELFINSLQPYLNSNLILIGEDNTYGKPVGFFPIDLLKKVTFWTVSFETRNKNDGAVPYTGFGPNYRVYDGVDKPWGDPSEDCLKAAIDVIEGKQPVTSAVAQTAPRSTYPSLMIKEKEIFEHSNLLLR